MKRATGSLLDLSIPEKIQLVEDLWDEIASDPDDLPVHEWQKEEVTRRKQNLMKNPGSALPWETVKERILSRDPKRWRERLS